MRVLLTHGYLLTGTGSNLYVQNLAHELCKAGHDVSLVCQEPRAERLEFVSDVVTLSADNARLTAGRRRSTELPGRCRVFRPRIGDLLPVYVHDHYEGFRVKEFPDCYDEEIERYIECNRAALATILAAHPADVIHTNHTIMFPAIVERLGPSVPHVVTVHGSALNFSVRRDRRLTEHALAGLTHADAIVVDSLHARDELGEFLVDERRAELTEKVSLIPAGVDVERFRPLEGARAERIERLYESLEVSAGGRTPEQTASMLAPPPDDVNDALARIRAVRSAYDYRAADADVVDKLRAIDWTNDRVVLFVGKYLWTKGLHLILHAVPRVLERHPDARFVFVGFGPFREPAEYLVSCMAARRLDAWELLLGAGAPGLPTGNDGPIPLMVELLRQDRDALERSLDAVGPRLRERIVFTGLLNHVQLGELLPCAELLVAPSVFPEAFGMVAVEALASGVYPIVTLQSAFAEIADVLQAELSAFDIPVRHVPVGPEASQRLADDVNAYLDFSRRAGRNGAGEALRRAMRGIAERRFSWEGIARRYDELYRGQGQP